MGWHIYHKMQAPSEVVGVPNTHFTLKTTPFARNVQVMVPPSPLRSGAERGGGGGLHF